jgi:D-arabinose 5-phosphate isomerase GutQ/beta-phosphoglucomutase-like phosphatase (HAD superfamily)
MNNILEYDLFIFDFDGTLMNTEPHHCKAWSCALSQVKNREIVLSMQEYQKYFHSLNDKHSKIILKALYDITDYDNVYKIKQEYYQNFIKTENIQFVEGAEKFLKFIIENNKKFIIVTNTAKEFIKIFKEKHPILSEALKIYTKDFFVHRKPNPECYLKIMDEYRIEKKIAFEDSLVGIHALYQVNDITPVLIYDEKYYFLNEMYKKYSNLISLEKFDLFDLENKIRNYKREFDSTINNILINNIDQLQDNLLNMGYIIKQVTTIISNLREGSHIYLSGMGKSGYVCKKCASTWQSLSIKCSYIDLPNLPHGDFGIFNDNDILILISNSGNTEENVYILKYIKDYLKKKITTISIVANTKSEMEKYSTFTYVLNPILEADRINMTPSTSSLVFMALLDGIAINLKKDITKEEFKLAHPGGSLGKK